MTSDNQCIDISIIKGLIGDDEDTIKIFFRKFATSTPENINSIKQSIDNSNFIEVKAKAHKLKSSAKAIGANTLANICQNMENSSAEENKESLDNLYIEINAEFKMCNDFINLNILQ